jgi:hypothetical protein
MAGILEQNVIKIENNDVGRFLANTIKFITC